MENEVGRCGTILPGDFKKSLSEKRCPMTGVLYTVTRKGNPVSIKQYLCQVHAKKATEQGYILIGPNSAIFSAKKPVDN
jgi:hypothetical protein